METQKEKKTRLKPGAKIWKKPQRQKTEMRGKYPYRAVPTAETMAKK